MEATVICVDNSEWTRNSDYAPTRFQAQADCVNLLAGAKTQIAQLALKHRQNKNQRQRAVIFVGSPIKEDKDKLVKIAKKMKKNNVAVDIVSFGSEEQNTEKLEAFHEAVNSGDNSHLVTVPPGMILSDSLFGSPIFQGEGAAGYGGGSDDQPEEAAQPAAETTSTIASAKQDEEMEDMDEELHRALQMSMQDHGDTSAAPGGDMQQILEDSTALNSILGTLPGVNPEDPALQASLQASLRDMQDKDSKDKDKKDSK
ncbi:hypothetical protein WJX79_000680 [Trebouxia sp. C0005]